MAVEIKELHVKTSIRSDAASQSVCDSAALRHDLSQYCQRIVQEMLEKRKER